MTIRKGVSWGESRDVPDDLVIVDDDLALGRLIRTTRNAGEHLPQVGVRSGALAKTLGGGTPGRLTTTGTCAPIDILRVTVDGQVNWAVAHVVARRSWWGEVALFMNAQFLGELDLAPRSHPNDGRVDVLVVDPSMTMRDRIEARRRARTGTHLPHPKITSLQRPTHHVQFHKPLDIRLDGEIWLRADHLDIDVEADALTLFA